LHFPDWFVHGFSTMENIVIESLRPADILEAAQVISYALVTNPTTLVLWGAQGEKQRLMIEKLVLTLDLGRPHSMAFAARLDGRIVAAVNMVEWPHCKTSLFDGLKQFPLLLPAIRGAMLRYMRLHTVLSRYHPNKPHWHLGPIGVLPELQDKGIGSMFATRYFEVLDQRKAAAYLETTVEGVVRSRNRLDFEVLHQVKVLGLDYWLMWRAPRQASERVN